MADDAQSLEHTLTFTPSPDATDYELDKPYEASSWDSINACVSASDARHMLSRSRSKDESSSSALRSWIIRHQIGLSVNILTLIALTHLCFPRARRRTRKFFELSYYDASSGRYTRGMDDFYYIAFWITIFTGLRAAVMTYILLPFAQWAGLRKEKAKVRFTEQAWLLSYYLILWPLGLYLMSREKYWFNLRELWTDFPVRFLDPTFKWYYLVQWSFWIQQILVIFIEERRKDHWQMFAHHIVTCSLIMFSYGYYQTRVGNVILVLMDAVDLVFPVAKMLKYAGYQKACDVAFGLFIITWFVARHCLYLMVCWSIYSDVPRVMKNGCYSTITGEHYSYDPGHGLWTNVLQPYIHSGGPICYDEKFRNAFLGLLLVLQGITVMWFGMILRVLWKVLKGEGADDSRSDDEAEVEDEMPTNGTATTSLKRKHSGRAHVSHRDLNAVAPIEESVGVEGIRLRTRREGTRSKQRKSGAHGGPLSMAGSSDRKELLGRIGCDKPM